MTQKEILDSVLQEIRHIKSHMPNGEMKIIQSDMKELKEDVSELKYTLLNPEDGVIVNTNKNTEFRKEREGRMEFYEKKLLRLDQLEDWQKGVNKALWIIFGSLATIIIKLLVEYSDKG